MLRQDQFEQLFKNIGTHIQLSDSEKAYLTSVFQIVSFAKNEVIQEQGEQCKYIYFLNDGILRAFHINPKGKETTVMFAQKDWWITDMHCFLNEQPAMVNIVAVEVGDMLRLSKEMLEGIYKNIPQFNTYFRILVQNAYCREQLRTIQNLSLSAKERYHKFLQKYPHIARKITLKQTASYLGITPEFLSAIRAEKD